MKWMVRNLANRKKRSAGFTLVELMIVIIIVGVLAAAAVPIYRAYVRRARASEAKATIGLIKSAEEVYYAEHDDYLPNSDGDLSNDNLATLGVDMSKNTWWKETTATFSIDIDETGEALAKITATAGSAAPDAISGMTVTLNVADGTWDITY